jgi:EARLY FLOWERING 3 protein
VQDGSYDGRYSYVPCYLNPMGSAIAYMPSLNVGHRAGPGQASLNGTSSSTVVDGDTELQCVPLVAGSSVPMPGPKSSKKGKLDDDFAVPTYSTATQGSSQKRSTSSGPQSQEAASREHRPTWRHWDSGKQKRFNTEAPGGSDQPQVHKAVTNSDDVSSEQTGCLSEQTGIVSEQNGGLSEQNCGLTWYTSSVTASVDDRDVRERVIDQTDADLDVSLQESDMLERDRDAAEQLQPSLTSPCSRAEEAERLRRQSEHNRYSSGNSENVRGEVSEQVGRGCSGNESESSMLDYVPVENTTPLDVMSAIGQQEFWRVRKTILR